MDRPEKSTTIDRSSVEHSEVLRTATPRVEDNGVPMKAHYAIRILTIVALMVTGCGSFDGWWHSAPADERHLESTPVVKISDGMVPRASAREVARISTSGILAPSEGHWSVDWSPKAQALAYATDEGVFVARAPDFVPLPVAQQRSMMPLWSPDGQSVAFVGPRGEGDDIIFSLWLASAEHSAVKDLLPGDRARLSVSNFKNLVTWVDERTLSFAEHVGTGLNALATLDLLSGEVTFITARQQAMFPRFPGTRYSWSPDRKWVAVEGWGRGIPDVALLDMEHRTPTQIGESSSDRVETGEQFRSWSPDSRSFLYAQWTRRDQDRPWPIVAQTPDLYRWDVGEARGRVLVPRAYQAAWSPDGSRIAFLLLGNPFTDQQGRITGTDFEPGQPLAVYLGISDTASGRPPVLIHVAEGLRFDNASDAISWFEDHAPHWSPDGSTVAYIGGTGRASILASDGRSRWQSSERVVVNAMRWSADGAFLALQLADEIRVLSVASAQPDPQSEPRPSLTATPGPLSWDRTASLAFATVKGGVYVAAADGSRGREIPAGPCLVQRDGVFALALSPEGKRVALGCRVARGNGFGTALYLLDLSSSERRLVRDEVTDRADSLAWSPDGRHLVYSARAEIGPAPVSATELWLYEPATGRHSRLAKADHFVFNPVWDPDGSAVVYRKGAWQMHNYNGSVLTYRVLLDGSDPSVWLRDVEVVAPGPEGGWLGVREPRDREGRGQGVIVDPGGNVVPLSESLADAEFPLGWLGSEPVVWRNTEVLPTSAGIGEVWVMGPSPRRLLAEVPRLDLRDRSASLLDGRLLYAGGGLLRLADLSKGTVARFEEVHGQKPVTTRGNERGQHLD